MTEGRESPHGLAPCGGLREPEFPVSSSNYGDSNFRNADQAGTSQPHLSH